MNIRLFIPAAILTLSSALFPPTASAETDAKKQWEYQQKQLKWQQQQLLLQKQWKAQHPTTSKPTTVTTNKPVVKSPTKATPWIASRAGSGTASTGGQTVALTSASANLSNFYNASGNVNAGGPAQLSYNGGSIALGGTWSATGGPRVNLNLTGLTGTMGMTGANLSAIGSVTLTGTGATGAPATVRFR